MRTGFKIALLILVITVVFYWKILLVHQFSLLLGFEGANQAYSWFNFWVATIRQGIWPIWDPFTFSGHAFAGEMQTGAFYPLYLVFLLVPFNHNGVFSPQLYHVFYVLTHVLCAWFVYLLAGELNLSAFAGLVSGICFSLGGLVVRLSAWPHMLESAIWLPLILLCLLRAMKMRSARPAVAWSALGGLCLAMAVLAGGLHVVIMDALVVVSAVAFYTASFWPLTPAPDRNEAKRAWMRAGIIVAVCIGFGLAGGAVQLLPSAEYSRQAFRFVGPAMLPATQRIPYAYMGDGLWPHTLLAFVVESFAGSPASAEYLNPYLGVFPLLLAMIGIWKRWGNPWVRYLSGLALVAALYTLASFTLLHGVLYAITPLLWMAREADRFIYLTDFSLAILAGFGIDAVFHAAGPVSWESLNRILRWVLIGCVLALIYPFVIGKGDMNAWISFSLLLVILSYGLFQYLIRGHRGAWAHFLLVALILFDLGSFDWSAANKLQEGAKNADQMERLLSTRGVADFLRSRTGPFRVQMAMDYAPNIGDLFGIQTVLGAGVTLQMDFERIMGRADLLNAWYQIRPASAHDPGAVYADAAWKVYENPRTFPRAWLTHEAKIERDPKKLMKLLSDPGVNLHRTALLDAEIEPLDATCDATNEYANFRQVRQDRLEVKVRACGRALLVLSEMYYPGWKAEVNGKSATIRKVDSALRGIEIPSGDSLVSLYYAPVSVFAGALLTAVAFLSGGFLAAGLLRQRGREQEAGDFVVERDSIIVA